MVQSAVNLDAFTRVCPVRQQITVRRPRNQPELALGRRITAIPCFLASELEHKMTLPSVEILEANHTFPGPYTFKVIGADDGNFAARVVSAVRDELQMETDPPYTFRTTKNGKHVSITLEPECQSAQQVIAIYSRLMGMNGIVMLL